MKPIAILGGAPRAPVDKLRPHPLNDNRESPFMFGKLLSAIRADGFAEPITVRSGDEKGPFKDGKLEIVGGEHRWKAAKQLRMTEVPIHDLGCVSDAKTKHLILTLNKVRGEPDQDALARLVREIATEGGNDALEALPFDEDTLRDLIEDDAEDLDVLGLETPTGADDDAPPVDLATKASARDLLVILECQGLPGAELRPFLDTVREWVLSREAGDRAPWEELADILRRETGK